jgi:large subunit ribosomal protein L32
MAAVPKKRISKARRGERRAHLALEKPNLMICPNCKKKKEPHTVCKFCGYYDGKEIK